MRAFLALAVANLSWRSCGCATCKHVASFEGKPMRVEIDDERVWPLDAQGNRIEPYLLKSSFDIIGKSKKDEMAWALVNNLT